MSTFLLPSTLLDELQRMLNSFWWGNSTNPSKGVKWMKWEKICVRKELGGRGFRDLHLFNIALLGKIGWRLLSNPTSLVARILKAKYYPNSDFLHANLGHNSSYTWSSIIAAQDLLKNGMRWKIGTGEQINVWQQPWLADDSNFYVQTPVHEGFDDMVVADLLVPGTRMWDKPLIEIAFNHEDAAKILQTLISPRTSGDKLIWHYSRD